MNLSDIGDLIFKIGIEPVIIVALLYYAYKLSTDHAQAITDLTCSLNDNTGAMEKLTEYVRGQSRG